MYKEKDFKISFKRGKCYVDLRELVRGAPTEVKQLKDRMICNLHIPKYLSDDLGAKNSLGLSFRNNIIGTYDRRGSDGTILKAKNRTLIFVDCMVEIEQGDTSKLIGIMYDFSDLSKADIDIIYPFQTTVVIIDTVANTFDKYPECYIKEFEKGKYGNTIVFSKGGRKAKTYKYIPPYVAPEVIVPKELKRKESTIYV